MTRQPIRYTMVIQWSSDDEAFVVCLPEWEGHVLNPVTHGETYEQAAKHGLEVLEGIIAVTLDGGESLPDVVGMRARAMVGQPQL